MEPQGRPLGLGVLAVVSFGLALYNLQSGVMLGLLVSGHLAIPEMPELVAAYQALPGWFRWFLLATTAAKIALLVTAGLAYLGRRRVGRLLGTGYGLVSIGESIVTVASFGSAGRDSLIAVLFAVYTVLAVNTMYRAVLSR